MLGEDSTEVGVVGDSRVGRTSQEKEKGKKKGDVEKKDVNQGERVSRALK